MWVLCVTLYVCVCVPVFVDVWDGRYKVLNRLELQSPGHYKSLMWMLGFEFRFCKSSI